MQQVISLARHPHIVVSIPYPIKLCYPFVHQNSLICWVAQLHDCKSCISNIYICIHIFTLAKIYSQAHLFLISLM